MSKLTIGYKKRKTLFKKYATNLLLLTSNELIDHIDLKYDETYICPICLRQFSEQSLEAGQDLYLTLEDVPPQSLGGKPVVLTCNQCNNMTGTTIDSHLLSRMKELDAQNLLPKSSIKYFRMIFGLFKISQKTCGVFFLW